ncbi:LicD family protein [Candidatus Fukatsuia symbiotica]|uniref:LicD family protein n=1 Tax=Candidatus Fukatsuia symbiotica TaxID=1878942 RepID=A0A2U8I2P8_9GAMM|nr:LicD family protein [Candidatus Fukatsuia symbiotica]AWK13379.1 LicD family protein [Candidatus Fukatsuia symbiotica]MEA9444269.1 LicD family protein [Candidatus Fukatsuia symbiotica]
MNNTNKILRQAQLKMIDALKEINRICIANNINYWLDSGTLLGAQRDGRFISWDDDIDIGMTRKDYNRFIQICDKQLNKEKYFLQTAESDPYYININVPCKLRILNTKIIEKFEVKYQCYDARSSHGLFIDIFPFDKYSKHYFIRKYIERILSIFFSIKVISYFSTFTEVKGIKKLFPLIKPLGKLISKDFLISTTKKISRNMSLRTKDYVYGPGIEMGLGKIIFSDNEIFPLREIKFEDTIFKCPNNVHSYLTKYYGDDYMELPPENKRVWHFESIEL